MPATTKLSPIHCPSCHVPLVQERAAPFAVWRCRQCGGCSITMANLRKAVRYDYLQSVWDRTRGLSRTSSRHCPSCRRTMHLVPTDGPEIDLCRECQMIWFDAHEVEELPLRSGDEIAAEKAKAGQIEANKRRLEREREARKQWQQRMQKHGALPFQPGLGSFATIVGSLAYLLETRWARPQPWSYKFRLPD